QKWVFCFDLTTNQEARRWSLAAQAHGLAFHPDNRRVAVGSFDSSVVSVYDSVSGTCLAELPVGAIAASVVAWDRDGERPAITGADPRIQIWNATLKRPVATLAGHVQFVSTVTFHPEVGLLASHSWDSVLRLWDPATGRPLLQFPLALGGQLRYSGDGRW